MFAQNWVIMLLHHIQIIGFIDDFKVFMSFFKNVVQVCSLYFAGTNK